MYITLQLTAVSGTCLLWPWGLITQHFLEPPLMESSLNLNAIMGNLSLICRFFYFHPEACFQIWSLTLFTRFRRCQNPFSVGQVVISKNSQVRGNHHLYWVGHTAESMWSLLVKSHGYIQITLLTKGGHCSREEPQEFLSSRSCPYHQKCPLFLKSTFSLTLQYLMELVEELNFTEPVSRSFSFSSCTVQ